MATMTPLVMVQAGLLAGMGALLGGLAVQVYRRRSTPGSGWFAGLLAVLACGIILSVALALVVGFDAENRWLSTLYAVLLLTPIPWIAFVARFTGRGELLTGRRLVAVAIPLVAGVLVVLTPLVVPNPGPLFLLGILVVFFYAVMLVFVGAALLIRTTFLYTNLSIYQGIAPSIALIEPWFVLTVVFQPVDWGLPIEMGFVTGGMGLVTLLLAASVLRLGLLDTAAAAGNIGQEAVIEEIDEIIIVVDDERRIVKINETAKADLNLVESKVLGAKLESVINHTLGTLATNRTIEVYTASGYRTFETNVSPLLDQHDRKFGTVVTLSDVTRREIRQGQLEVLNRVLRHNLRNKMDIIHALAGSVETPPEAAQQIKQTADELLSISNRAREIEQSMQTASITRTQINIAELAASVGDDVHGQYPDASIEVSVPGDLTIRSDATVLKAVLSNLVENAVKHNDSDCPQVSVRVGSADPDDGEMMEIVVADNGPGISDHERAVIERGRESALQHGSGLGLWTAQWGARILGGYLTLNENTPRGTVARVGMPVGPDVGTGDVSTPEA